MSGQSTSAVKMTERQSTEQQNSVARIGSIVYYMGSSIATQFSSKSLLTIQAFHFPISVTFLQMLFTAPVCYSVDRPAFQWKHAVAIMPLAAVNALNVVSGLIGTGGLNVPMFIVLRRFTMVFTLAIESYCGIKHDWQVLLAVAIMIVGAILAAATDLTFSLYGYAAVLLNDIFTATYLVMLKNLPVSKELSTTSLLFYNSFLSLVPLLVVSIVLGEWNGILAFPRASSAAFQITLLATVMLGLTINHSTYLCTRLNDPLTTSVAGSMKNIAMTVIGAMAFGDFTLHPWNALGIAISMVGAIYYANHAAQNSAKRSSLSSKTSPICKGMHHPYQSCMFFSNLAPCDALTATNHIFPGDHGQMNQPRANQVHR